MKLEYYIDKYVKRLRSSENYFHTFIDKQCLAAGVMVLDPNEEDVQEPHESDEVYFVVSGNGFLRIKNKDYPVSANKMFFVAKDVPHFFHDNTEELIVLYFFGGTNC